MSSSTMKQHLLKHLAVTLFTGFPFLLFTNSANGQSCFNTGINGTVFSYICPQSCTNLNLQIHHIQGTGDYTVGTIPYEPFPWTTATGTELIELYADDRFSPVINLPFPFCFYGSVYNSCVVGSNGLITFDLSNAGQVNAWSLTTVPNGTIPQPIPYAGGAPNTTAETYYPRASIMGAYHDIFPLLTAGGLRKVEYYVTGTAPCRKFVVSFYSVPLYGSAVCNSIYCSQQIVLHENTGIIDVYFGNKPVCNNWNEGLAILGLQNWDRTAAVAAPGKNCTVWSESSTAYRFTPSGTGSRFVRSELFTLSGTLVATADTLTTTAGLLDLRFLNICPPPDTTPYEVRTTFSSCNNPAVQMVNIDTIRTIRNNQLGATATSTNNACGPPSGTISVTIPVGAGVPPFTYILDGGVPVVGGTSYTFSGLLHGPHTIEVTDANGAVGCTSTIQIIVGRDNALLATTSTTQTFCAGSATGTITVTPTNGIGPYTYILNGGLPVVGGSPYTYTGLSAGVYLLDIEDATGCQSNPISITVTDGTGVVGNASSTSTTCPAAANGTVTVNITAGIAPYTFSLDSGTPQTGPNPFTFSGVAAGAHTVLITDDGGCTLLLNVNVTPGPVLTAVNTAFATSCFGAMDGSIRISPVGGVAPYTFSLDGAAAVPGSVPHTFFNLNHGIHNIQVFDASGCETIVYAVDIPAGPALTTTAAKTDVLCNGDATGTITVSQPAAGQPPYEYSLDGTNWQSSNQFTGLTAGSYTVRFRSADGCSGQLNISINEPAAINTMLTAIPVVCNGQNNGVINAASSGGVPPYQYSINGGTSWQSSSTFNVSAGSYTIITRDVNDCLQSRNITVTEPAVLAASSSNSDATCDGGNNGTITVTATGGNGSYQYALDGGSYQSSNVFNTGPGTFTVHIRDQLGCSTSFTTTVGLNFNLYLNPMADLTICEGSSVQFLPVSNAASYNWSPSAGLNNPNIATPTANPVDTTWYYLTAVLGRCTLYDTIRLNVNKAPVPDAGPDAEICYGQSHTLQGSGGSVYTWSPAIYLNTTSGANPVSTPTLSTVYFLSVRDHNNCPSLISDMVRISVKREMSVQTFPFDTIVAPGETFQLLAVSNGISYNWSPATGLSDTGIANPYVTVGSRVGDEIYYQVSAVDSEGCRGEGYVRIKIHLGPAIYVPTAFTPNNDGKNDRFTPHPVGISRYNYFRVFNRWGQVLFSSRQLHHGWDGNFNGQAQPAGTYVWMIEGITNDNKVINKKGTVTLIR